MSRVAQSRTMSRMKNKPSKPAHAPTPPARQATARTEPRVSKTVEERYDEPQPAVLREPTPKKALTIKFNGHFFPGVKASMTTAEIAALGGQPATTPIRQDKPEARALAVGEPVAIVDGAEFSTVR